MAIRLATSADYLQRTSSLPSNTGTRTVMYWVRANSAQPLAPDYRFFYGLLDDPGSYSAYFETWATSRDASGPLSPGVLYLEGWHSPQSTPPPRLNTGAIAQGVWVHHAIVSNGSTHELFLNGVSQGTYTYDGSGDTYGYEMLGGDTYSTGDQDMAFFRQWSAALNATEIDAEMRSASAVRTANLFADTPLTSDALDDSGNGRDWTEVGTVSYVSNPTLNPTYLTVYEQAWANGNSTFSQQQYYNHPSSPEPVDPLYLEMQAAESVQVNTGGGPSGENTLDNWTGGGDNDYSTEGVNLHLRTRAGTDPIRVREGRVSIWYKPTTQSLADNAGGYCPLIELFQFNDTGMIFALDAYPNGSGPTWQLLLTNGGGDTDYSHTFTPVAGTPIEFAVEFKRDDGGTSGYLRAYMDGVLIYDMNAIFVKNHASDLDAVRTAWIGFFGLFGETTNFRIERLFTPSGSETVIVPAGAIYLSSERPEAAWGEVEPEPGESFGPLVWVEWSGSDGEKRIWAPVDLADPSTYYGGFKEARLLEPRAVIRALTDEDGQLQSQQFSVSINDDNRDVRGLLGASDMRRVIVNTLMVMRMISDHDRRALLTPRTVAIGVVRGYTLE